ncbi:MAG: hypothetical protein LBD96_04840 [Treponema sp.]|jgi:tetratricopeptide (TPR) repeat protein|nr:hypothetical protein [Treponema sp.]
MTQFLMIFLGLTALLPSCGGGSKAAEEYDKLRNGNLAGEELVLALEDFELRYPEHLYIKVDLGTYYLAKGEEGRAWDYLRRAQTIAGQNPVRENFLDGDENYLSIMYGALGQICLNRGEYDQALEYAEQAIESAGENAEAYRSLKGHILIALQDYAGALDIFDGVFSGNAPGFTVDTGAQDILAYLLLLTQAERSADAVAVLNRYFQTGAFFPSLGIFAAAVYRSAGEMERAAYAIYLEEEYRAGYGEGEDRRLEVPPPGGDFFAGEYLAIKEEINRGSLSEDQFRRYIELESYFRLFPSYYWNLWLGARLLYPESYGNFAAVLQKIISLDNDGPFAKQAWQELGALFGY